jgi:hypothetical protein
MARVGVAGTAVWPTISVVAASSIFGDVQPAKRKATVIIKRTFCLNIFQVSTAIVSHLWQKPIYQDTREDINIACLTVCQLCCFLFS